MTKHPRDLIAAGVPLQIEIKPYNRRHLAALVQHPDGWIFADIGWCDILNWPDTHLRT
jgi:hypothetical protein